MLVFTSCVANYLPKARVLAASLKEQQPDWQFCLLLGEDPPAGFDLAAEPFDRVIGYEDLEIPDLPAFLFKHRLVELCTAVKGMALNHFLEKEKQPKVIYLDPDIMVLGSMKPLEQMLDSHDILLTPHQLAPQTGAQAIEDNEICSLRHGVFNLGFVAAANRPEGIAFSRFWRDRLQAYCRDDKNRGLFTDQKWCDLAPAYFPSLGIVRDPGCNAASWNLTDRRITRDSSGRYLANGAPLRFYHFTGYDSGMGRVMSSIYGANMPAVAELWNVYDRKLRDAGHERMKKHAWSGGFYANREPISDEARVYYRETPSIQALYPDPYDTDSAGKTGFAAHWRRVKATEGNRLYVLARKPVRLAWLAHLYLRRRGGLKAAPQMARAALNAWRRGGLKGLIAKIRKFKHTIMEGDLAFRLDQLITPANSALRQWDKILREAFGGQDGVLFLDHMYGGGANDYREKRIAGFLEEGRPCLLLTWDFFAGRLRLRFSLPGGRVLNAEALDLADILEQDNYHFGHIVLSELVLWSSTRPAPANHHDALSRLLDTVAAIKSKNSAILEIAVHDFYPVCPNYYLLENGETYCSIPADMARCGKCLKESDFGVPSGFDLRSWRKAWQLAFAQADKVSLFSYASADILGKCFAFRPGQTQIAAHLPLAPLPAVEQIPGGPLHIGVIGHIARHKGANIVRELAELLAPGEKLTVIGALEGPAPANITVTGSYQRENMPAILQASGVNCCLVASIWPETFCYVVQEIMQMQMPLVVFPLGAQAERVANYEKGKVAETVSASAALKAMRQLASTGAGQNAAAPTA